MTGRPLDYSLLQFINTLYKGLKMLQPLPWNIWNCQDQATFNPISPVSKCITADLQQLQSGEAPQPLEGNFSRMPTEISSPPSVTIQNLISPVRGHACLHRTQSMYDHKRCLQANSPMTSLLGSSLVFPGRSLTADVLYRVTQVTTSQW